MTFYFFFFFYEAYCNHLLYRSYTQIFIYKRKNLRLKLRLKPSWPDTPGPEEQDPCCLLSSEIANWGPKSSHHECREDRCFCTKHWVPFQVSFLSFLLDHHWKSARCWSEECAVFSPLFDFRVLDFWKNFFMPFHTSLSASQRKALVCGLKDFQNPHCISS